MSKTDNTNSHHLSIYFLAWSWPWVLYCSFTCIKSNWKGGCLISTQFTFISLEHIFVRLGIFLLLRVVCRQQTRYEAGHGASASRLASREGGRPADYRSDPVCRGASSHSSGSFSPLGSTIRRRLCPELGMHLADTGRPVARFRAGLDNPRGLLKTRPEEKKKNRSECAIAKRRQRRVYLPERRLHKRYLSIIAGALRVCAAAQNRIARCAISLVRSFLQYRLPTGVCRFMCHYARRGLTLAHPHPR